jgi:hypothetical protein
MKYKGKRNKRGDERKKEMSEQGRLLSFPGRFTFRKAIVFQVALFFEWQ